MMKIWNDQGKTVNEIRSLWNDYVSEHLLTRIYGFEIMMAPYAVAHLKIGLALQQSGYQLSKTKRLNVYLTNALSPPSALASWVPDFISDETSAVNTVKKSQRFTVVIGNPPYSKISSNLDDSAVALIEPFRYVHGKKLLRKQL